MNEELGISQLYCATAIYRTSLVYHIIYPAVPEKESWLAGPVCDVRCVLTTNQTHVTY